jgi:porin
LLKVSGRSKFGRGILQQAGTLSPVNRSWLLPSIEDRSESFLEEYYITQGLTEWMALIVGRFRIDDFGDINRLAGNEQTQFLNTLLRNSPILAVLVSSFSLHGALLAIEASPIVTFAPFGLSRNDRDNVYGSPGGLFSEYSVGAQMMINWKVAGLTGEFIPIGGYTNKEGTSLDNPFLILEAILGLGDLPQKKGNWMIGFSANQYFYVPKEPSKEQVKATPFIIQPEGIGVFMRFHYAPEDRNLFSYFVSAGIMGRGVIPMRPLDRYGVGFYGLFASDELEDTLLLKEAIGTEWGMEVFYNIALTPWLQFGPSVQYVDSGLASVDHSVVVTTRLQLYF